jgi:hypothetical protein
VETKLLRTILQIRRIANIPHTTAVIHGSQRRRRLLIPRKPSPTATKIKKYRQRAVYATSFVEIGVMYAVIKEDPLWKIGARNGLRLKMPEGFRYTTTKGFIHVCQKQAFKGGKFVSIAKKPVRPIRVIPVSPDLLIHTINEGDIKLVRSF